MVGLSLGLVWLVGLGGLWLKAGLDGTDGGKLGKGGLAWHATLDAAASRKPE